MKPMKRITRRQGVQIAQQIMAEAEQDRLEEQIGREDEFFAEFEDGEFEPE